MGGDDRRQIQVQFQTIIRDNAQKGGVIVRVKAAKVVCQCPFPASQPLKRSLMKFLIVHRGTRHGTERRATMAVRVHALLWAGDELA